MKNTEREVLDKTDKVDGAAPQKKVKEGSRQKGEKSKEKVYKERPVKPKIEKKKINDSSELDQIEPHQETEHTNPPKKSVLKRDESKSNEENAAPSKSEDKPITKNRTDHDSSTDKEKKIRNKDRPAIQIYRPGAKRIPNPKSVSQDYNLFIEAL